ncbi:MAG: hypothetical protein HRF50_04870 [Phycisphaerae bacterium]|jgi:hypothetical protein
MSRPGLFSIIVLGAGCAAGALLLVAASHPVQPGDAKPTPQRAADSPIPIRGMAIQISNGHNPLEVYPPMLREIADLGANTVLLSPAGYMEHAKAQSIVIDVRRTPTRADFAAIIREAHGLGLKVILMPTVLLSHPRGSEWRGVIEPPDWKEWWEQYRDFLKFFCDVGRDASADVLMVGSELVSTEKQTEEWLRVVEMARSLFPAGKLGYSANWDHYRPVKFWDKLDLIGMTSYYTLAQENGPSVEEIAASWAPVRDEITAWVRTVGKPLVLTEVGWCSQEGASTAPWNYYHNQRATAAGHEEQRRLYEGFIRAWDGVPELGGVIWWEWTPDDGGPNDFGYTPRNKPAEHVLRAWFADGRLRERAASRAPESVPPAGSP